MGREIKIHVHVGFPKCGSTSLQQAMNSADGVCYPQSGTHALEHLCLPLHLKGVDRWTAQWFSEQWVETELQKLMDEIHASSTDVFLSSERLVSLSPDEVTGLAALLNGFDVSVLVVIRKRERFLDSLWRHAVFRHDYHVSWEDFLEKMKGFSFGDCERRFAGTFPVRVFNMDQPEYAQDLSTFLGTTVSIPHANTGVPSALAELLQRNHALLGTEQFRRSFPPQVKDAMRRALAGETAPEFNAFDVPLF
jgi:hypothetical protein